MSIKDFSKPQGSIGDVFGTIYEKICMSQRTGEANRLHWIEAAQRSVTNDARHHQEARLHLVKLGTVIDPKEWQPREF